MDFSESRVTTVNMISWLRKVVYVGAFTRVAGQEGWQIVRGYG